MTNGNKNQDQYENHVIVFLWKAEEGWPVEIVSENIAQFGYSQKEFAGEMRKYADIVHPDDIERVKYHLDEVCASGAKDFTDSYRILTASGDIRRVLEKTLIERDLNGEITHLQGFVIDITEQFGEIKDYSDFTIPTEPVIIFVWKAERGWPVEYVSEEIRHLGYDPEEFLSGSIDYASIIHQSDLPNVVTNLDARVKEGYDNFDQEYRIYTKSGEIRNVVEHTFIVRDDEGKAISYQGIIEEITSKTDPELVL